MYERISGDIMDAKSLYRKLKALSENNDNEFEAANAREKLEELMRQNGWTDDDSGVDETLIYSQKIWGIYSQRDAQLLVQIYYKVTNDKNRNVFRSACSGKCRILDCTREEFILTSYLYHFYYVAWKEECAKMFDAFIQKHQLFGDCKDGEGQKLSIEEQIDLRNRMRALDERTPCKLIDKAKPLQIEHKS
jgi:hypothetical protein